MSEQESSIEKQSALPHHRYAFLPVASANVLDGIRNGLLLIVAFWSGPALVALQRYTSILRDTPLPEDLEIIVVDTDGLLPELRNHPALRGRIDGWCEVAIIQRGNVVEIIPRLDLSRFRYLLSELIDACGPVWMYCAFCGASLTRCTSGEARCDRTGAAFSSALVKELAACFATETRRPSATPTRFPMGSRWYCPRCGVPAKVASHDVVCGTCGRHLNDFIYQLVELTPHLGANAAPASGSDG
jgi:hypothetical protein